MEITVEKAVYGKAAGFFITTETPADAPAREALLDRAMGADRKRKASEKLRHGRMPAQGLSFVARNACGAMIGTVRLWNVAFACAASLPSRAYPHICESRKCSRALYCRNCSSRAALLLGPLAVDQAFAGIGVGAALMRCSIGEAARLGHGAILLVGDAPYYGRFGFSDEKTGQLAMPGPYEKHRFLALELRPGALDGAFGTLRASGRTARGVNACCLAAA